MSDDCTCELYGDCAVCRPAPINPHTLDDERFLQWCLEAARTLDPDTMREAYRLFRDRFDEPIVTLTPEAIALRRAMDAGDPIERWLNPDDPTRLTREASRLYMETLRVY